MELSFDFLKGDCLIRISSFEDIEVIADYYRINTRTVDCDNWSLFPYLFYNNRGLHGAQSRDYADKCLDFLEWTDYAGISLDIEESDMDISDLLFS